MNPADEKPVELLNKLIGISNNRIEVYSFAEKNTESNLFKSLFGRLVETSLFCREPLKTEVYKLGGLPLERTLSDHDTYEAWLCMHQALRKEDNRLIAAACLAVESASVIAFKSNCCEYWMLLNSFQRCLLKEKIALLSADLSCVSNLKNIFRLAA